MLSLSSDPRYSAIYRVNLYPILTYLTDYYHLIKVFFYWFCRICLFTFLRYSPILRNRFLPLYRLDLLISGVISLRYFEIYLKLLTIFYDLSLNFSDILRFTDPNFAISCDLLQPILLFSLIYNNLLTDFYRFIGYLLWILPDLSVRECRYFSLFAS